MNHTVNDYNADRSPKVAGRYTYAMSKLEEIEAVAAMTHECNPTAGWLRDIEELLTKDVPWLIARVRELEELLGEPEALPSTCEAPPHHYIPELVALERGASQVDGFFNLDSGCHSRTLRFPDGHTEIEIFDADKGVWATS
jgi:hypothetical protein